MLKMLGLHCRDSRQGWASFEKEAEDIQQIALRCDRMPDEGKEVQVVTKHVRHGIKNMVTCVDDKAALCQTNLLDMLDASERSSPAV